MATFKVGQRVRILDTKTTKRFVGCAATVIEVDALGHHFGRAYSGYALDVDGHGRINDFGVQFIARAHHLAPLTPPAEDTWAADQVRKVTNPQRYMEPSITDAAEAARERIARDLERGLEKLWGKS